MGGKAGWQPLSSPSIYCLDAVLKLIVFIWCLGYQFGRDDASGKVKLKVSL